MKVVVVDYGVGNLGSIPNMIKRAGADAVVSSDPATIAEASRLILPGVGAFDAGMKQLVDRDLIATLERRVIAEGVPTLGLCLGMQLLFERSEEGANLGLGWMQGQVVRFAHGDENRRFRVPQMGWNELEIVRPDPLVSGLGEEPRFYFAHSYHVACDAGLVIATTVHGYSIPAIVRRDNIWGAQFHPEKSHRFGLKLLSNFLEV